MLEILKRKIIYPLLMTLGFTGLIIGTQSLTNLDGNSFSNDLNANMDAVVRQGNTSRININPFINAIFENPSLFNSHFANRIDGSGPALKIENQNEYMDYSLSFYGYKNFFEMSFRNFTENKQYRILSMPEGAYKLTIIPLNGTADMYTTGNEKNEMIFGEWEEVLDVVGDVSIYIGYPTGENYNFLYYSPRITTTVDTTELVSALENILGEHERVDQISENAESLNCLSLDTVNIKEDRVHMISQQRFIDEGELLGMDKTIIVNLDSGEKLNRTVLSDYRDIAEDLIDSQYDSLNELCSPN